MVKEARNINPFGLRMPPDLRGQLEDRARESGRSLNAEIVQRLQQSLSGAHLTTGPDIPADFEYRLRALEQRVPATRPKRKKR